MSEYEALVRVSVDADDFMGAVYDAHDGLDEGFTHIDSMEADLIEVSEK